MNNRMSRLYLSQRTKRNGHLAKWFAKWHRVLKYYENRYKDDLPYWHTERTNIGHLALAAYDVGGFPLQEYSTLRRRGAKGPGRADLYVEFPFRSFNIEAKQRWPTLDVQNSKGKIKRAVKGKIKRALDLATGAYKKLSKKDKFGKKGLAFVFVVPIKKLKDVKSAGSDDFKTFQKGMENLEEQLKANFLAIHFAGYNMSLRVSKHKKWTDDYWHPGIAIIGRWI